MNETINSTYKMSTTHSVITKLVLVKMRIFSHTSLSRQEPHKQKYPYKTNVPSCLLSKYFPPLITVRYDTLSGSKLVGTPAVVTHGHSSKHNTHNDIHTQQETHTQTHIPTCTHPLTSTQHCHPDPSQHQTHS